jgi:site-specific DNA-methyltransferase (adenine-specific)
MKAIPSGSVDMILTDPPYGTTACKWDNVIPFEPMWEQIWRVLKPNGACLLFGSEPFSTHLRISQISTFKYDWIWKKSKANGWQHAANMPMKTTEIISVFSQAPMGHVSLLKGRRMAYYPQGVREDKINKLSEKAHGQSMGARPNQSGKVYMAKTGFPSNFLEYGNVIGKQCLHPTQKPVALLEYLIKTYTLEGETVLDFTMGSGSTGVACVNTGRKFIGIEMDDKYFEIAKQRIETTPKTLLP